MVKIKIKKKLQVENVKNIQKYIKQKEFLGLDQIYGSSFLFKVSKNPNFRHLKAYVSQKGK
jgi:hypothetical protein